MSYQPADRSLYSGRDTSHLPTPHYWYQTVQMLDRHTPVPAGAPVLIGYAVDEGVMRNQGRIGAAAGPDAVRRQLAGNALPHPDFKLYDRGNVYCPDGHLSASQHLLADLVHDTFQAKARPFVVGGGHDIAYGSYLGLRRAFPQSRIGILNFDAHLDLRTFTDRGTSGTPFYQILSERNEHHYCAVGIQRATVTPELLDNARRFRTEIVYSDRATMHHHKLVEQRLKSFVERMDVLYVTIDLDGFASAFAPGVSAPSPTGMTPEFVAHCLNLDFLKKKLKLVDFAELNPKFDTGGQTAKLVGRLVYGMVVTK